MKKIFKIVGIMLGVVVLVIVGIAAYVSFSGIPSYATNPPDLKVEADSTMIAEGKRLATLVCNQCHMNPDGSLTGKELLEIPESFGQAWSANITRHKEYGAGKYTDGELAYLLRTGVKRDGSYAPPWMPKFPHMSDYDLNSVIAYLRSDLPETAPSKMVQPACEPSFLTKMLCQVVFKPIPYPEGPVTSPDPADKVAYGEYLANAKLDCFGCHSASFETQNILEPTKTPGYYGGGNSMPNLDGEIIFTKNLTPHKETGIGNWTEEKFIKAVKFGQKDGEPSLRYPMPPYAVVTDEEASAIWAYLQTIPEIENDVEALYK